MAVGLVSASTLAYEILLVRVFAIEQFHHFAYMAIGVAMLGFGFSGTLMALWRRDLGPARSARWFAGSALATPVALVVSLALVHRMPLDASQLPWDPGSWGRLAMLYVLLATPFAVGALAILLGLTLEPQRVGTVYGANFVGAGLGAALSVGSLWLATPDRALAFTALLAALAATSASFLVRGRVRLVLVVAVLVASLVVCWRPPWDLQVSPFKGLPQVEAYPGARRVSERAHPVGWAVAVEASAFRHAPGLSLAYRGTFPSQAALFVDANLIGAASDWGDTGEAAELLDWLPSAMPYALDHAGDVLVVGAGGGTEVWNALVHGARRVSAVEIHPALPELATSLGGPPPSGQPGAQVVWEVGDARGYTARSDALFDVAVIGPGRPFASSAAGVHALSEDFLHTVEAYGEYLKHLNDGGVLTITRWLTVPPRSNVRVILTAVEALRRLAPDAVDRGVVVARSWATATVLVRPAGFSSADVVRLSEWAEARRFDLDYYPGIEAPAPRFNELDEPVLFRAARAAVEGRAEAAGFADAYAFHVAPAHDARPYPHHFLRLGSVGRLLSSSPGGWLPFAEWGYVSLLATLGQSIVLAVLLLLVPAALRAGGAGADRRLMGYFAAIGFAYLAAEIAAIQQLQLLLGHPVYAVAATLAAFLIFSGAGSIWSDGVRGLQLGWRAPGVLAVALTVYGLTTLSLVTALQPWPLVGRAVAGFAILAPLAFVMGLPFPLGLRQLAGADSRRVAWAWAANGFASVVAAPGAALITLEAGSRWLLWCAAAGYAVAAGLYRLGKSSRVPAR